MTIGIELELAVGLCHTTFHFPELADVNQITSDAVDPKSGTAEFKAAAIRIDRLDEDDRAELDERVRAGA